MTPEDQLYFYSSFAKPKPKPIEYLRYNYRDIARSAEQYKGLTWKCSASVFRQIDVPNSSDVYLILLVNGNSNSIMYAYAEDFKEWTWAGVLSGTEISRLLTDDKIEIDCVVLGEFTFSLDQGAELSVPYVEIKDMTLYT